MGYKWSFDEKEEQKTNKTTGYSWSSEREKEGTQSVQNWFDDAYSSFSRMNRYVDEYGQTPKSMFGEAEAMQMRDILGRAEDTRGKLQQYGHLFENAAELEAEMDNYVRNLNSYLEYIDQMQNTPQVRDATLKDITVGSFNRGFYNSRLGEETFKELMGVEGSEADKYREILSGEDYQFKTDNWLESAVSGTAEQLGQMLRQHTNARALTAAAAGAGGAWALGKAGPQALLPEEVITMPAAAFAGIRAAGMTSNMEIEAGHAYNEMLELGIDADTAKGIAFAVGGVNAGIEGLQLKKLEDAYKTLVKSNASDTLTKRIAKELADRGVDVAKETAQEVAQEAVTMGGVQVAHKMDKGETAYSVGEMGERLGETAVSSALTFGLMNAPAGAAHTAQIIGDERRSIRMEEYLQMIEELEAKAAPVKAEAQTEAPTNVSERGKTVLTADDTDVDIESVSSVHNGKMTYRLTDGRVVSDDAVLHASADEAVVYNAVAELASTPGEANAMIEGYKNSGMSADHFTKGIRTAHMYGKIGASVTELEGTTAAAGKISSAVRMAAYNAGKKAAGAEVAAAQAVINAGKKAAIKSGGVEMIDRSGKAQNFREYVKNSGTPLDAKREAGVMTAELLHEATGVGFRFYESYINGEGNRVWVNESGQEESAPNGFYRSGGVIYVDLNAGNEGNGLVLYTEGHEVTHFIKEWSPAKFKVLGNAVAKHLSANGANLQELLDNQKAKARRAGREMTDDEAFEEVVADSMEGILADGKVMQQVMADIKQQDKSLWEKIVSWVKETVDKLKSLLKAYDGVKPDSAEGQMVAEMKDAIGVLEQLYADALKDAGESFQSALAELDVAIDADTESVAPTMFSERTWRESDYVKARDEAAKEIAKAINVSVQKAKDYIDDVNSIAKMIAEDRTRLDYFSSPGRSSFVSNVEYGGSFDFSTLCKKRRLLTGTFTAIQRALPNTALTADEILEIRGKMKEAGLEVSCGLCYVEGSRANMGQFAKEFLKLYKKYYPDNWQPNMADVNTPDGIEWVRINHPECYEQYEYFWNHYGTLKPGDKNLFASQQKPKLYQLHTEYKGEILQKFKDDDNVEEKNLNGGIRMQSFSDFEIVHLIDTMQIIMDMSRVGLAGQAYTKVPDFAWALGDTGLKINLSLIAKDVDADGNLIFDDVEGMPIADAMALRDRYSANVGTICVAFTDEQLLAAMKDDRVDFVIPFHRSQWKKSQYSAMGLPKKTKDYTYMQNEKFIKPQYHEYRGRMVKDKATNYMPNEYWDFTKSGKENAEAYLEMCARNNKRPKFYKLLENNGDGSYSLKADGSTDGYWKLLIDFKMYDNNGVGSPQMPVKPDFNMAEATRMLNEYSGGHQKFPVAQGIVDEFVTKYKETHKDVKYSGREGIAENKKITISMTDAERTAILKDKVIKAAVYEGQADGAIREQYSDLESGKIGLIKSALVRIGEEFGVFTDYEVSDVEVKFTLSRSNLKESVSKEVSGIQLAKLLPVLKQTVENAIGIECHANRYFYDYDTVMFENLMGGYIDGESFIPVRFGLKHSQTGSVTLYVIVDQHPIPLKKIKAEVVNTPRAHAVQERVSRSASEFSIDSIVRFVNGKDLLRYLPNDMLSEHQRTDKWEAIAETIAKTNDKNDRKYSEYIRKGDTRNANRMVATAAKAAGYNIEAWHGTRSKERFTVFSTIGTRGNYGSHFTTNNPEGDAYNPANVMGNGNIYHVYLKANNPFETMDMYADDRYWQATEIDRLAEEIGSPRAEEIRRELRKEYPLDSDDYGEEYRDSEEGLIKNETEDSRLEGFMRELLEAGGYDSLAYQNEHEGKLGEEYDYVILNPEQIKSADVIEYDDDGNAIPLSKRFDETNTDIRYSLRSGGAHAPTFYSHMARVIDDVKQEKLGAASVVPMLRGKGVKQEEIKWSGIEEFLAGKKSVTKQELQEFAEGSMLVIHEDVRSVNKDVRELNSLMEESGVFGYGYEYWKYEDGILAGDFYSAIEDLDDVLQEMVDAEAIDENKKDYIMDLAVSVFDSGYMAPRWAQYSLEGGNNYRELTFIMPDSDYKNASMTSHWGESAEGILAHARVQDFDTSEGKMLFVEEIQSDWHNAGHKEGYKSHEFYEEFEKTDKLSDELFAEYNEIRRKFNNYIYSEEFNTDSVSVRDEKVGALLEDTRAAEKKWREVEERASELRRDSVWKAPDAPFRDTYHEFVMKRLIRMAAEEGYDSIGWTTADIQSKRWSDEYAEGYRIEYDQDIPKFLRKYGKKWGATVGKSYVNPARDSKNRIADAEATIAEYQREIDEMLDNARESGWMSEGTQDDIDFLTDGIESLKETIKYNRGTEVWSMPITDEMWESVLFEGQPMYSLRDTLTDQEVLKRAAEGLAIDGLTPAEQDALKVFRKRMKRLEGLQAQRKRLGEQYRKERFTKDGDKDKAEEIHKMMTETDRQIDKARDDVLKVEQAEVLRRVLKESRKIVEADERRRVRAKERERSDAREAKIRKDYAEKSEKLAEGRKDRADKKELRSKIRKTIRDLDKLLNKGDKKRNVKEDMKELVSVALRSSEILFTDELTNADLLRNGIGTQMTDKEQKHAVKAAELTEQLMNLDPAKYDSYDAMMDAETNLREKRNYHMGQLSDVFVRERRRLNEAKVDSVLSELSSAYASLQQSEHDYVAGAYEENVYNYLDWLREQVKGTLIKDMSVSQLQELHKAYTMVLTTVRNANEVFAENLKESRAELATRAMREVHLAGGVHGLWTKAGDALNAFDWNNLKPVYAFERIGSSTLMQLFKNIRSGEDKWYTNMRDANDFRKAAQKKFKYDTWDMEQRYSFKSSSGIDFSLNLDQIMSLYAFSKREQAHNHLLKGGFVFDKNTEVVVEKNGIKMTYLNKNAKAHNVSFEILEKIIKTLTNDQRAYVDVMQEYLSSTMGEKGNEVSMKLYGVKMFGEKFYFPLRSAGQYLEKAKETDMQKQQGQVNLVSSAFTKNTVPKASNPIVLDGFTDVWCDHVNEMSMYNAFVLPLEDFRKVYSFSTPNVEGDETVSVNSFIQNAYGDAATAYIDQLIKDLNGGALSDNRETIAKRMIALFKKASVFASASVIIQQPMSVARAFAEIDARYFLGEKMSDRKRKATWDELKKYAPVAGIKEMGYFDTGMGMSAREYLQAKEYSGAKEIAKAVLTDSTYRDEWLGRLPALADEAAWCAIWNAVKRETKSNNPKMDVRSEEFLQLCGERFTEIITKTQVYDSVLARSANMRSKTALMSMATSFMGEPTTVANMAESAFRKWRAGDKEGAKRQLGAVLVSTLMTSAAVSLVYAARDDDEDETYLEKYMQSFAVEIVDGINPMTYLPFVKDGWSILQGYDVERADMSLVTDLANAVEKIVVLKSKDVEDMSDEEFADHKAKLHEAWWGLADYLFAFFGLPVKNVRRDVKGAFNVLKTVGEDLSDRDTTWGSLVDKTWDSVKNSIPVIGWMPSESKQDKLYDAIMRGDTVYADRLKGSYKDDKSLDAAIRKALRANDPRIREAAIAWNAGEHDEYMKIAKTIIAEKNFTQDNIVKAITAEAEKLSPDEGSETAAKHVGLFNMDAFGAAVQQGSTGMLSTIRSDIIDTHVRNGKTRDEAVNSFNQSAKAEVRDLFMNGEITERAALNALTGYCGVDKDAAAADVQYWAFKSKYPDIYVEDSWFDKYHMKVEASGIGIGVYMDYRNRIDGIEGKGMKERILDVIDSMPITSAQKDALYFSEGYAKSTLRKAPWH